MAEGADARAIALAVAETVHREAVFDGAPAGPAPRPPRVAPPAWREAIAVGRARRGLAASRAVSEEIAACGLFDADWYRATYPDVTGDPLRHYVERGAAEGRNPGPRFSSSFHWVVHGADRVHENPLVDALRRGLVPPEQGRPPPAAATAVFSVPASPALALILDGRVDDEAAFRAMAADLVAAQGAMEFGVWIATPAGSDLALGGARRVAGNPVGAWNVALRESGAATLVVLGPGVTTDAASVARLVAALRDGAGLACGLVLGPDGSPRDAGFAQTPQGGLARRAADRDAAFAAADVDAVSPLIFALPAETAFAAGGFDEALSPEGSLLALSLGLRANGGRIAFCASAVAWSRRPLAPLPPDAVAETLAATLPRLPSRAQKPRALFIDYAAPMPDRDSGSGDIVAFMRIFQGVGYEVSFLSVFALGHAGAYAQRLRDEGIVVVDAPSHAAVDRFVAQSAKRFDVILVYRAPVAGRIFDAVRAAAPQAKIVFDTVDLHFLREEREAAHKSSDEARAAAANTRALETRVMAQADATIVLSAVERDIVRDLAPQAKVHLIPIVRDIPGRGAGFKGRAGLLFVGGFAHAPNVDAIGWFVRDIWPLARAAVPGLTLTIVGSGATPAVRALAGDVEGVFVLGFVEDLAPLLDACLATVAPLRYGAGVKGKVVTSLAHGVPCVATSVAVEGMAVQPGRDILVADAPADFAAAIAGLAASEERWTAVSDAGLQAAQGFSVGAVDGLIRAMLRSLDLPA